MCRLYGFHSNEPTKVECTLVHSQNSLLIQSQSDALGRSHADGWGIAWYGGQGSDNDQAPSLETSASAAFSELHFSNYAERVYARTVVAHVRLATVGTPSLRNSHPFRWNHWVFAHNGTVVGIDRLRPQMLQEIGPDHSRLILGTTDSELLFHWLLADLVRRKLIDQRGTHDLFQMQQVVRERLCELDDRCQQACPEKQARLNVILTNGSVMLASRLRNSLYLVDRVGIHDCEICGIPHVTHNPDVRYQAVIVASEPLSHEKWQEVPDGTVLSITENMTVHMLPMEAVGIQPPEEGESGE